MTTVDVPQQPTSSSRGTLAERAASIAPELAAHAARHDIEGTFVTESLEALRSSGLLKAAVPVELGGDGATPRELTALQRRLARSCGSTALASSMHQHVTCFTAWRWRRGLPGAEATLRRVAEEGIVLVSTGGGDYTRPRGTAVPVEGGFRVTGTKRFASLCEQGTAMSTMFVLEDPERGRRVLNMAIPFASEGVALGSNWDAHGMRGTGSHDVRLDDVFVPAERVLADRPWGVVDGPLQVISSIAFPIISGAYLGVAEAARDAAVEAARGSDDPLVHRSLGLIEHRLRVASWALDGALDAVGDDPSPSDEVFAAVMAAKREVALAGREVCDLALEVVGGQGFFRGSVVERCVRDVRAAGYHPLTPEQTLVHAGRLALGLDVAEL